MLSELLSNDAVIAGAISFLIAQFLKPFVNFLRVKEWDWVLLVQSGGMPSSHSSMITAVAISIGLWQGFDTGAFAVALAMMMIVTYDAANVRWQSGLHAQRINQLIRGVFSGEPITDQVLKEVIGHTPSQVFIGILLGIVIACIVHFFVG